ncbi:hypothetical protein T05_11943 [Trichinella murrelli]|uniref:Uncharacterized protein n=1 Tax=Trichinella murrelli TaxID=144512 RepID=A0A0V0TDM2_9BILA|nr:hypothetical protein T05_11943 [Trichinella murrelli]
MQASHLCWDISRTVQVGTTGIVCCTCCLDVIQASLDKLNSEVPVPFNHTADDNSLSIENA